MADLAIDAGDLALVRVLGLKRCTADFEISYMAESCVPKDLVGHLPRLVGTYVVVRGDVVALVGRLRAATVASGASADERISARSREPRRG
jgi:hypothetical protein